MKYLIAFLSGIFVTLIVFVSGVGAAIFYLKAEPAPVRPLDTTASQPSTDEPVRVVVPNQHSPDGLARSDQTPKWAAQAQDATDSREIARDDAEQTIDRIKTAATSPEPTSEEEPKFSAAHVAWCSERYRSYDPDDNKYNAYSGARPECVSPYSEGEGSDTPDQVANDSSGSQRSSSSASTAQLDPEHVQSCLERYRSYRPEDNTYQPYGGGPRRQCE